MPKKPLRTGPPDFVGVGAQRSGTTWWFRSLVQHPAIRAPRGRRKEQHFFDGFGARPMTDEHVAAYHDRFPRRPGQLAGEWTPRYMMDPWAPRLLQRAAPEARILVMLRDPIERYRSGVVHRIGRAPEGRRETFAADNFQRGLYTRQVRRVLDVFGRDRVLVLQYERCREDPEGEYLRTLRFLGADPHVPDLSRERGTSSEPRKAELWPDLMSILRTTLEPDVRALRDVLPELDLSLWPNFAHLAADATARTR